jgi:hypothetical protein
LSWIAGVEIIEYPRITVRDDLTFGVPATAGSQPSTVDGQGRRRHRSPGPMPRLRSVPNGDRGRANFDKSAEHMWAGRLPDTVDS